MEVLIILLATLVLAANFAGASEGLRKLDHKTGGRIRKLGEKLF